MSSQTHDPMISPPDSLEVFERMRPRLFGLAYRMTGSVEDAEDLVQEAYLRWHEADRATVRNPEAWLISVTTRLSIDRWRRLAAEREAYPGNWLPEPIATDPAAHPERAVEQHSDLSVAFLLLLERLGPEERAAFVLREVFDTPYEDIARALQKSEPATRQLVHRARTRVREGGRRYQPPAPTVKQRLFERFVAAVGADDERELLSLFVPDAVLVGDGGGKVAASPRPIEGADRVAHLFHTVWHKSGRHLTTRIGWLNGEPALVTMENGAVVSAMTLTTDGTRIVGCYSVLNPDKLRGLSGTRQVR